MLKTSWRVLLIAVWLVLAQAAPAQAHTGSGLESTNYRSVVTGFQPDVAGFTADLAEAQTRVQLQLTGQAELVVLGYADEPYLRVGPDGAFENQASPSVTINQTTDAPIESALAPNGEPRWKKLGQGSVLRWYDKRANFTETLPPAPGQSTWSIPVVVDGQRAALAGTVEFVPGPNPSPKYVSIGIIALVCCALVLSKWWRPALAASLTLLVVTDVAHSVVIAARKTSFLGALGDFAAGFYAIAGWAMAGVAVAYLYRPGREKRDEALFFAMFAAVIMGFFAGLGDAADLARSQLRAAGPPELTRWLVVLAVGLGTGIFVGCLARFGFQRRSSVEQEPNPAERVDDHDGHERELRLN